MINFINKYKGQLTLLMGFLIILWLSFGSQITLDIPESPLIFPGYMLLWMGMFYLMAPELFKKNKRIIIYGFYFVFATTFLSYDDYTPTQIDYFSLLIFIPIPILVGLWFYEQWKHKRQLKAEKNSAELALLRTQINPHFFFNTLNNLYSLTVKQSKDAPGVILKLSEMMRYTIYEGKKDIVALRAEVNYLKHYIELHQIRYKKAVDIQFTSSIREDDVIAPLLFIVLLENAFKHGVESLSKDAYIKMSLESHDTHILFQLENNFEEDVRNDAPGIGIENLQRRLALIYPNQHEFSYSENDRVFLAKLKIHR